MKNNQNRTPILEGLEKLESNKIVPLGIPGHKGSNGLPEMAHFFGSRIVDLDAHECYKMLDKYPNPTGMIKDAEYLASKAYGADHAHFLVNGTSSGIMAMIMSVCEPNDKIIVPRNAHKSVISALILTGAVPVFIQPEINESLGIAMGVTVETVKNAIVENPDAKAVFLIHSTFYGAVSDIKMISKIAHEYGMPVLVDEAHGAHFKFHPELPSEAIELGADMCAVSTHKTGGSFVQSSILLVREGYCDPHVVKMYINMLTSTSASFLLLASLDVARKQLVLNGEEILSNVLSYARWARGEINKIEGLYCYGKDLIGTPGVYDYDETKLGICVKDLGLTGYQVYDLLLYKYDVQVAISDMYNILAILSIGETRENLIKLVDALKDISLNYKTSKSICVPESVLVNPEICLSPRNAFYAKKESIDLDFSVGMISGETVMAYPPGIPIVIAGEKITIEIVEYIKMLKKIPGVLHGMQDKKQDKINIICEE